MDEKEEKSKDTIKGNNEETKYIIVYSSYGYLKISEKELNNDLLTIYKFIQYKTSINNEDNLLRGFIYKGHIKSDINLKIKYFQNKRSLIPFNKININDKINILIENLFKNEEPKNIPKKYTKNSQYRLYSCISGLRELNTGLTFSENNIRDNETLLFFKEPILCFSTTMKGKSIEISQQGKTAFKIDTDDPHYVLGTIGYNGGRHYYEIKLMTEPMLRSIVVGLCTKNDFKNSYSYEMTKFYGYILSDMKKTEITFTGKEQENMGDYGEVCSINDVIGILYDCRENGVNISFYRNKKNLGIAFNGLPNDLGYFPVVEMGYCGSKIQIFNEIDFPEDK